jgi:hypothetical protein
MRPCSKRTREITKRGGLGVWGRAGGVAQAVEHLPSKLEALSSNPVSPQNKIIK